MSVPLAQPKSLVTVWLDITMAWELDGSNAPKSLATYEIWDCPNEISPIQQNKNPKLFLNLFFIGFLLFLLLVGVNKVTARLVDQSFCVGPAYGFHMPIEKEVVGSPSVPLNPDERLKRIKRNLVPIVLR